MLLAAGMFAYFFFSALYLQRVLGYTPLEVGFAYLPSTIIWGLCSLSRTGSSCASGSSRRWSADSG